MSSNRIRAVRAARNRASSATMAVHALRTGAPPDSRVAVVASRRVGGAVARNRAKRRLRAAVRQARLPGATDLVVDARPATVTVAFTRLHADLERLSARAAARAAGEPTDVAAR